MAGHSPSHFCQAYLLWVCLFLSPTAFAADWPQFLGPDRDGVSHDAIVGELPAAGPAIIWRRDVGAGLAGPVVVGRKVIVFDRADDQERLQCLDAATGKTLWTSHYPTTYSDDFGFDEGPRATPDVVGDRVYTFGAAGMLACWDLATGKSLWAVDTLEQFHSPKGYFGRACSPVVEGDVLILNVGALKAGIVGFDRNTGKVLWRSTSDAASYSSPTLATFNGNRYALVLTRAGLVALEPASGHVAFSYPFRSRMDASVNAATPIVVGDDIFLSASYGTGAALLRFDEKKPAALWSGDNILSNHYATSIACNGYLYGFDGRQEQGPSLRCAEFKTGKVMWSEDGFGAGTLLIADGKLVIITEGGALVLAPATPDGFKPTAKAQILGAQARPYPALADGFLYARDKKQLVCVDLRKK